VLLRSIFFVLVFFGFSKQLFAQNTWGVVTRPLITRPHLAIAPNSRVAFENNLMNHISDELRVDTEHGKPISCKGDSNGQIIHRKGGRVIPIQCSNSDKLDLIKHKVSQFYGHEIGMHLKYAFESGPYLFAICNYDNKGEHTHSDHHYVCRTPLNGASKINDAETYCYKMGFFHRTCNPHKALVSTEIITINSKGRWVDLDKTILMRFMKNNESSFSDSIKPDEFIKSFERARVHYPDFSRGAPDSYQRYPKVFVGRKYACIETLLSSKGLYVETRLSCGDYNRQNRPNTSFQIDLSNVYFQNTMKRLKQESVYYPMISPEYSSVE